MPAPKGNSNAAKGKDWENALRWALENYSGGKVKRGEALRAIATKVVKKAITGNKDMVQEIGCRLDGKPVQAVSGTGEHGELIVRWLSEK